MIPLYYVGFASVHHLVLSILSILSILVEIKIGFCNHLATAVAIFSVVSPFLKVLKSEAWERNIYVRFSIDNVSIIIL